ncbi:MAG: DUF664 domain-containing protein [Desulfobacterales bacterium]
MEQFFADYLERLQTLHEDLKATFKELPQAALDWVPGPDMLSFCVLVVHASGAERYWIGDVACQDPSGRDRAAEFRVKGLEAAKLQAHLDQSLAYVRTAADKLTLAHLAQVRVSLRDNRKYTVGWALAHALEHTALHLGHAQVTRQLWGRKL